MRGETEGMRGEEGAERRKSRKGKVRKEGCEEKVKGMKSLSLGGKA